MDKKNDLIKIDGHYARILLVFSIGNFVFFNKAS